MRYTYSIERINKEDRWIFLTSNDVWDLEEPDSFVFLLKKSKLELVGQLWRLEKCATSYRQMDWG